jgi:hypothetical protein
VSSFHAPSWADFITTTLAFRFSIHTHQVGYRTDASIVFDIFLGIAHREAGIDHWEIVHARKWIASTIADGTSSLPDVSGMHGFAACRTRRERIREPRLRVRQVLHDESRSCGDWSNEISQRQVGRKSVAQPKRTLTSRSQYIVSLAQHFVNELSRAPHFSDMAQCPTWVCNALQSGHRGSMSAVDPPPSTLRLIRRRTGYAARPWQSAYGNFSKYLASCVP